LKRTKGHQKYTLLYGCCSNDLLPDIYLLYCQGFEKVTQGIGALFCERDYIKKFAGYAWQQKEMT